VIAIMAEAPSPGGGSISRNIITDVARGRGNGVASKVPDVKML